MNTKTFKELRIEDELRVFTRYGTVKGNQTLYVKGILINDEGGLDIITTSKTIQIPPCSIDLPMYGNDSEFFTTSNLDNVTETLSQEIYFLEEKIKTLSKKKENAEKCIEILKKGE